ncbi:unnamed protein product [Penicillium roqueforti FM164]|uniref:Genomic scaffold, ProqFM164S03 n=1 Tax=Penicillium roqueforti (strain FM164) TaxID=1365484 RepID=W6QKE1_PENRF|nr:unnamed protein product [Penicillium roqueforti FM164]
MPLPAETQGPRKINSQDVGPTHENSWLPQAPVCLHTYPVCVVNNGLGWKSLRIPNYLVDNPLRQSFQPLHGRLGHRLCWGILISPVFSLRGPDSDNFATLCRKKDTNVTSYSNVPRIESRYRQQSRFE